MSLALLAEARRLHRAGYDLIPLEGKRPIQSSWTTVPRLSLEQLETELKEGRNLGMRLGQKLPNGRFIACLDVDVVGALTSQEQIDLDKLISQCVNTASPIADTGYGNQSRHIYVATTKPAKTQKLGQADRQIEYEKAGQKKKGPVWTLELRGFGAQVVVPPSVHPDTRAIYKWRRGQRLNGADSLPEFEPVLSQPQAQAPSSSSDLDPDDLPIAPFYRQLLKTGDIGEYASRSEALYAVMSVLIRDTDLTDKEIEQLLTSTALGAKVRERPTGWAVKQAKKLRARGSGVLAQLKEMPKGSTSADLRPLFEQAAKAVLSPMDRAQFIETAHDLSGLPKKALVEELDSIKGGSASERARLAHGDPVYEEVLERHALVSWAGKPAVFRERLNPPAWESRYDIMTLQSLAAFYENKPVLMGKKAVNPVEMWRADPDRREYLEGARMVPSDEACPQGIFNLWQGFSVQPRRASVSVWRAFLSEIICGGHAGYAEWLEDWIADMFQNPSNPQGVAVVLRGEEGIGKGTFANVLGRIMGGHYRHVTQESQLTGRFNGHFADSLLIFADELVWGGEKKHRGTLYALVTEQYLMVERKNFDAVPMRNMNRLIIASNNDWVVPTGMDGRRWFVLDVGNARKGDTQYFATLREFLHSGGYEAILDYYLRRSIKHDLRRAPVTRALIDQKVAGFDAVPAWWTAVLERGCIKPPVGEASSEWEGRISKELLKNSYQTFCRDYGAKPQFHGVVMKRLHKLVPWIKEVRGREGSIRVQLVEFPPLEECQLHFNQLLGTVE